ncbi:BTAD domain-containing putative transcriptional regulator [Nonomuraea sp. NEAU-A123]|uniref:BTAD domain-containing putative transcriptional regulator n=1 Tax=Nonomuraea sp. NEAU-A123 TaxID=2839649 RepID=UPI0027E11C5F|nr:BTAD domain-containing putative transcriptional regulator [Nonomuraea sp. NEAU-A123]
MSFGVLGPLAVWTDDGRRIEVTEPRMRALLADLLAHGGGPVSMDRLIDDLWGDRPSRNPVGTLQARVSQLRRVLGGPGSIVHTPAGYRLAIVEPQPDPSPAEPDADRFRGGGDADRFRGGGDADRFRDRFRDRGDADPFHSGPDSFRDRWRDADRFEDRHVLGRFGTGGDAGRFRIALDADRFLKLAGRRSAGPHERAAQLHEALTLWRGPAYADLADEEFLRPEIARLEEARLSALEEQAEVRLALGEDVDLADLVAQHPLRERLRAQHMTALYRGGRQGEALASYDDLRERLAGELGLDPTPELAALQAAILRQDPSLTARPAHSNLPSPLTELIGRDAELAQVRNLLNTARLVTLTGPGGVGKTRLALETARSLLDESPAFPDGVWLVELGGLADVAEAVADVLGVRDDDTAPLPPRLATALAAKRALLVIDNCEHLVEEAAALVSALLRAAPGLRVLATSREPLCVTGEHVHMVPPLTEPDAVRLFIARADLKLNEPNATTTPQPTTALDGPPTPHLIATSAGPGGPDAITAPGLTPGPHSTAAFDSSTEATATSEATATIETIETDPTSWPSRPNELDNRGEVGEAVAIICRRLDGIPLALELAATRVRALGVREVAERLDDRFRLLSSGMRDAPSRQRTLRAVIDWSWDLLSGHERVVLRRLAAHADGCTLEAAEAICAEPGVDVVDVLARLVDRSLVVVTTGPRYRLLESVAAYCAERLAEAGEHRQIAARHARYYTSLAERADLRGPGQKQWLERLDTETANLRLALSGPEPLRLVNALAWYWFLRGRMGEARRSLSTALSRTTPTSAPRPTDRPTTDRPTTGGSATDGSATRLPTTGLSVTSAPAASPLAVDRPVTATSATDLSVTGPLVSSAPAIGRPVSGVAAEAAVASVWLAGMALAVGEVAPPVWEAELDVEGRALADWFLTHVRWAYGDQVAHEAAASRALAVFEVLGDRWGIAAALSLRAKLAVGRADLTAMERDGRRSLELFSQLGDGWGRLEAMDALDRLAEIRGDYAEAARLRVEQLRLAEELGFEVAFKLAGLGRVALLAGQYERADHYHERARRLAVEQSYKAAEEHAVLGLALSARRQGRYERAEGLLMPWLGWLREVRGTPGIAFLMAELGFAAEQRGDAGTALARQRDGYEAAQTTGDPRAIALALEGLAGALSLMAEQSQQRGQGERGDRFGQYREAAGLLGVAAALREAVGVPLPVPERADVDRIAARLHKGMGEEAFDAARASGRGKLRDHFPGAVGAGPGVEAPAQGLHPLGHSDQAEPASQTGEPGVGG